MFTTIHSIKKSFDSRSRSQNNSQYPHKNSLQQSVLKRRPKFSLDKITQSKPMNILVNGKKINQILTPIKNKTPQKQIPGILGSPKKVSHLKQYIYRKYLTEFDDQLSPHIEGIIKIRQIFNQRNKGRSSSENVQQFGLSSHSNMYKPNDQLSKIINIRNPDIYAMTYKKRNGKYEDRSPSDRRYFYLCKELKRSKFTKIAEYQNEIASGFDIQPWEAD